MLSRTRIFYIDGTCELFDCTSTIFTLDNLINDTHSGSDIIKTNIKEIYVGTITTNNTNITTIGSGAFEGCTNVEIISIPNTVVTLNSGAFSVNIGEENEDNSINSNALKNLTTVLLPNTITVIPDYSFRDCQNLTFITIPNKLTAIGTYAFKNCISLGVISIPNTISQIDNTAFYSCRSLTTLYIDKRYEDLPSLLTQNFWCLEIGTRIHCNNNDFIVGQSNQIISINFYSEQGSVVGFSGLVYTNNWNNLKGGTSTNEINLTVSDNTIARESDAVITFSSSGGYHYKTNINDLYLCGYLDDNANNIENCPKIQIQNIPFSNYSIIIYTATDTENAKFKPVRITTNSIDAYYKSSPIKTNIGYAINVDETLINNSNNFWGISRNPVANYNINALRIDNLTGNITIQGGLNSVQNNIRGRGTIAAIQIINTGVYTPPTPSPLTFAMIDWSKKNNLKTSELINENVLNDNKNTLQDVYIQIPDNSQLSIDNIMDPYRYNIVGNNTSVILTDINQETSSVQLSISNKIISTGYTVAENVDGLIYNYIFRNTDTTTDIKSWDELSNWYTSGRFIKNDNIIEQIWIPYTQNIAPGKPSSNAWGRVLINGKYISTTDNTNIEQKIVYADKLEGWLPRYTVCNNVHLSVNQMNKLQSSDGQDVELRIDDTSKITIVNKGSGNNNGPWNFYVNNFNGLTFVNFNINQNSNYYFDDDGSVLVKTINNVQTIKALKLKFNSPNANYQITRRKLIGFETNGGTFTHDCIITTDDQSIVLTDINNDELIANSESLGNYRFKLLTDGYYIEYINYDEPYDV